VSQAYLSACAIYRDESRYLPEWLEFHRLMGVARFFLYDNGSSDDHLEVLAPYVAEGLVVVHDWPVPYIGTDGRLGAQRLAFDRCMDEHGDDSRWIAFLDIDEFLFSPTGAPPSQLLPEYEEYSGLCVSRAEFGSSGHRTAPEGLVIENYLHRRRVRPDEQVSMKSIVDPSRVIVSLGAHTFLYREGDVVDENRRAVDQLDGRGLKPVTWSRFRIHHYTSRSEEELERKNRHWLSMRRARGMPPSSGGPQGELDDTLAAYGPAVRSALERRAGSRAR
jgi:hypothetical protein